MRILLLFLTFPVLARLAAQIPIAEARDLPVGTTVTVRGVVTNGSELGSIRYIQDATAGIAVFPGTGSTAGFAPLRGADVTVTGPLKLFNGLLEIDPVNDFTLHGNNVPLPLPQVISPGQVSESNESSLIRINACLIGGGGTFSSGTRSYTSIGQSGVIYLRAGHPLIGTLVPSGIVDLVGIVSRFSNSTPPVGGYQLLLRDAADIFPSTAITLLGEVEQSNILPSGFTLNWNTNLAGSTQVRYGTTTSFGSLANATGSNTEHSVQLNGLGPAMVYHAQAFSVAGTDTAWSAPGIYSTASAEPGEVLVYFNKPVDHGVATGPLAIDLGNALGDTVKAYIDRAQLTLDIAVYNTTNNGIVNAVNDAHARGVQVRWIAEASNSNSALGNLHPDIPVLYRTDGGGSGMHNKFVLADADGGSAAHVLTGSANFTNAGFFLDANNLVIVRDMALARAYSMEFNEMWGGSGPQPNMTNSRFGPAKANNTPHHFNVGGTLLQSWFSPSDGTTARIVNALHSADEHIEFALFAFTSSTLASTLVGLHSQPGITVRGIVEEDDMNLWTYQTLVDAGIDVRPDGAPNYLHHKYAIVDRGTIANDPMVITGSHNWSFNAETQNDENTLIIHSALLADQFHQEWAARWTTAVGLSEQDDRTNSMRLWPNPASGTLWLERPHDITGQSGVHIADLAGRIMLEKTISTDVTALDIGSLVPGTYIVRMEHREGWVAALFVRRP